MFQGKGYVYTMDSSGNVRVYSIDRQECRNSIIICRKNGKQGRPTPTLINTSLRRRTNVKPTLIQRFVSAGYRRNMPANARRLANVGSMLERRRRRRANI